MGRSNDSGLKLGDLMHIHETHFHASCERMLNVKKNNNNKEKSHTAELVKYASGLVPVEL